MTQELWSAVDEYINSTLVPTDPALEAALDESRKAGLPAINVAPNQGKLLHLLARALFLGQSQANESPNRRGSDAILEIGTLGAYSTIWLARALPAGRTLITLEANPKHAQVAQSNIARAKLADRIELRLGNALESMAQLVKERRGPFDLIFIDADKPSYADYFAWSLKLSRPGTVIIADNVVRKGAVADATSPDPMVQGIQRFHQRLGAEPRVSATAMQTVGSKGYDGFTLIVVERT